MKRILNTALLVVGGLLVLVGSGGIFIGGISSGFALWQGQFTTTYDAILPILFLYGLIPFIAGVVIVKFGQKQAKIIQQDEKWAKLFLVTIIVIALGIILWIILSLTYFDPMVAGSRERQKNTPIEINLPTIEPQN